MAEKKRLTRKQFFGIRHIPQQRLRGRLIPLKINDLSAFAVHARFRRMIALERS